MAKWMLAVAVLAMAGLLVGGCKSSTATRGEESEAPRRGQRSASADIARSEPVEVLQVVRGDNDSLRRGGVTLVKDAQALERLGLSAIEGLSPDWAQQDVVVLALGEQNSGGFWADIKSIQIVGDTLYVQGVVNRPAEDAMASQALTYPYAAALINETAASRAQGDYEEVIGQPIPE